MSLYNFISLDLIDGLDNNFYVIDINGLIGLAPMLMYKSEFDKALFDLFGHNDIYINSPSSITKGNLLVGTGNINSKVRIYNKSFDYENKLKWRRKIEVNSPKISNKIEFHHHTDYPKFLIKPEFEFQGRGIKLFNLSEINLDNLPFLQNTFFEQFIPSKLIDNHCYSCRVNGVIDQSGKFFPLLYLNRVCKNPIIKNLEPGQLSEEQSHSYISNRVIDHKDYRLNNDYRLRQFIENISEKIILK